MKPAITKTKKAAIPAANGRSIARAIAKNETEKAAAIAEASRLMKLGVVIKAALEFSFGSCPSLVSPTFVSDLFSDWLDIVSDPCLQPVLSQVGDCLRPVFHSA